VETFAAEDLALPPAETRDAGATEPQAARSPRRLAASARARGQFSISLNYTPATGSGDNYITSTSTLQCNPTLSHTALAGDLDAGEYHCIVTALSAAPGASGAIDAASLHGIINSVLGNNAPNS
jgi:hypothetical protein